MAWALHTIYQSDTHIPYILEGASFTQAQPKPQLKSDVHCFPVFAHPKQIPWGAIASPIATSVASINIVINALSIYLLLLVRLPSLFIWGWASWAESYLFISDVPRAFLSPASYASTLALHWGSFLAQPSSKWYFSVHRSSGGSPA